MKKRNLIVCLLLLGTLFLVLQSASMISAATSYCAELTTYKATCQNVPLSQVDQSQPFYENTSCEQVDNCRTGTCINSDDGHCFSSSLIACNGGNGTFYTTTKENVPQCSIGCCSLGSFGASLTTDAGCTIRASHAGVTKNFDPTITDESTCVAQALPQEQGACVYESGDGRTCKFTTSQDCQANYQGGTFKAGWLCTNPDLGDNCAPSDQTTCIGGLSQIFFRDTCGNQANVYDTNKLANLNPNYWKYLADSNAGVENGVVVDTGDGNGNKDSPTNGNCNYDVYGSICMPYDKNIDTRAPAKGNNICRNVDCVSGTFADLFKGSYGQGRTPYNGETWCGQATATGIILNGGNPGINSTSFSDYSKNNDLPGSLDVLFTCANGRITTEINPQYRNKICVQSQNARGYFGANFTTNNWQFCSSINNSKDCANPALSCQWILGASVLKDTTSGTPFVYDSSTGQLVQRQDKIGILGDLQLDQRPEASCVPKYPPGFDPSVTGTTSTTSQQNLCAQANRYCFVNYSRGVVSAIGGAIANGEGWYVSATGLLPGPITCLTDDPLGPATEQLTPGWEKNMTNLCMSLGDCGVSINYVGRNGSNTRDNLFQIITGNWSGGSNV